MKDFSKVLLAVMIAVFALSSTAPLVFAQSPEPGIPDPPAAGHYVLDRLDWLTLEQEQEIDAVVAQLDAQGLAEIAVVTQDDCGGNSQAYRNLFFRTWGIGHKEANDGLLILVCWYSGDKERRKVEQEVGYGLEGTVPDLLTKKIFDAYFIPAFTSNTPGEGLVNMVKAYDRVIRGDSPAELSSQPAPAGSIAGDLYIIFACIVLLILVGLFLRWVNSRSGGGGYHGDSSSPHTDWDSPSSPNHDDGSSFGGGSSGGGGSSLGF